MSLSLYESVRGVDGLFFLDPEDMLDLLDGRSECAVPLDPMYGDTLREQMPRRLADLLPEIAQAA